MRPLPRRPRQGKGGHGLPGTIRLPCRAARAKRGRVAEAPARHAVCRPRPRAGLVDLAQFERIRTLPPAPARRAVQADRLRDTNSLRRRARAKGVEPAPA